MRTIHQTNCVAVGFLPFAIYEIAAGQFSSCKYIIIAKHEAKNNDEFHRSMRHIHTTHRLSIRFYISFHSFLMDSDFSTNFRPRKKKRKILMNKIGGEIINEKKKI